jgi:hypothetical protein
MGVAELFVKWISLWLVIPASIGVAGTMVAWVQACMDDFSLTCLMSSSAHPLSQNWWWWLVNFGSPAAVTMAIIFSVHIQTKGFTTRADGVAVARKVKGTPTTEAKVAKPTAKPNKKKSKKE